MNQSELTTIASLITEVAKSIQTLGNHIASLAQRVDQSAASQAAPLTPPASQPATVPQQTTQQQPASPETSPAAQPSTPAQTPAAAQTVDPFQQLSDRLKQIRGLVQEQAPAFNQRIMALIEKYAPGSTAAGRTGLREIQEAQYPALIADVEQLARDLGAQV